MRPSLFLRSIESSAKPKHQSRVPYEVWPLFVSMGFVCAFALWRSTKNLMAPEVRKTRQGPMPSREPEISHDEH